MGLMRPHPRPVPVSTPLSDVNKADGPVPFRLAFRMSPVADQPANERYLCPQCRASAFTTEGTDPKMLTQARRARVCRIRESAHVPTLKLTGFGQSLPMLQRYALARL